MNRGWPGSAPAPWFCLSDKSCTSDAKVVPYILQLRADPIISRISRNALRDAAHVLGKNINFMDKCLPPQNNEVARSTEPLCDRSMANKWLPPQNIEVARSTEPLCARSITNSDCHLNVLRWQSLVCLSAGTGWVSAACHLNLLRWQALVCHSLGIESVTTTYHQCIFYKILGCDFVP